MEILYSDPQIIVCTKPVGLDAEHEVPAALQEMMGGDIFPLHRLDKNVGGVMVFARRKKAAADFSRLIQNGEMIKEYVAQVHGTPPEEGVWEDFLFKDSRKNKVFVVKKQRAGVKAAKLSFFRATQGELSLVRVRLYTGRSHQIRVQFASRGFPLVGDHKYGARDTSATPMLWSYRISFPYGGKTVTFEKYPDWFAL